MIATGQVWALGAESVIFRMTQWGRNIAVKSRTAKPYLLPAIDKNLRRQRTNRECRMLTYARRLGVPTPAVYAVDWKRHAIFMDFIEGHQLKQLADVVSQARLKEMCAEFGKLLGLLHKGGIVHGDPTTSNVIVDTYGKMWIVDFGLGEWNATIEMMGVDLHLVRRALETTHWNVQDLMLETVLEGYVSVMGSMSEDIIIRMEEIRERGRYH